MKKEKDEINELFRTRLADTEMSVREGFWEKLSPDISVACRRRRQSLRFRVAAAASVLLVLAASSATFLYFSPGEEMKEAFTKIAVTSGGQMDGDGIRVNPLPLPVEPVLPKQAPKPLGVLSQCAEEGDSLSVTFSMLFSFSSTVTNTNRYADRSRPPYWQASNGNTESSAAQEEAVGSPANPEKMRTKPGWALKAQVGMTLPEGGGISQMPVSAGLTVERKLNDYLGVEAGLLYSNLRSEGKSLHYLGIPVKLNVTLMETKKVDLYAAVGGIADKCIAGAPDNRFGEEPVRLAVTAGVGVHYKITNRLAIFAEPGISYRFNTDAPPAAVRMKRSTHFNLLCGLRMTY